MNSSLDEPAIPPRLQRPLAAAWISLGLHAALIALVQVAPHAASGLNAPVIEARLVAAHVVPSAAAALPSAPEADMPAAPPLPGSSDTAALPVVQPVASPPATPPASSLTTSAVAPPTPGPAAPLPAASLSSAVDFTYYSAREVDVHPRALREIVPDYPADADQQELSGKVRLELKLEVDGRVSDVEIVNASPPGIFDESALKAFRDARFAPAQKAGRPVRARVLIEVVYDWEGRR